MSIPEVLKKWNVWAPIVGTILAAVFAAGGVQAINAGKAEAAVTKAEDLEDTMSRRLDSFDRKIEGVSDRVDDVYNLLIDRETRVDDRKAR